MVSMISNGLIQGHRGALQEALAQAPRHFVHLVVQASALGLEAVLLGGAVALDDLEGRRRVEGAGDLDARDRAHHAGARRGSRQ